MLRIERGQSNHIYPTCKEKQTLTDPYYLIKFYSIERKDSKYCIVNDLSAYPDRNQHFIIIETANESSGTNKVLLPEGTYEYYIYEQTSSSNVDPDSATGEVDQGLCKVFSPSTDMKAYNGYQSTYNG